MEVVRQTPARLVWHFLSHGKTRTSTRSRDQLDRLRSDLIERIRRVEAAREFPARVTPLCRWCDYESICPAFRAASGKPADARARAEEGTRLVDGYLSILQEVESDRAFAGDRLDGARGRLIDFSRREGIDTVVGKTHVARIRRRRQVHLPEPGSERRHALEAYLREANLWDGISEVDPDRLLWEIEAAPAGSRLGEAVRAFGSLDETSEVQLVPLAGGQLRFFE